MSGLTLDAGALIALERRDRRTAILLRRAVDEGLPIAVPAAVLAQTWRDGVRQAVLARLLRSESVEVVALDAADAKLAGQLCGASGHLDVVDASVIVVARRRAHRVLTSDPSDLRRLDPHIPLIVV